MARAADGGHADTVPLSIFRLLSAGGCDAAERRRRSESSRDPYFSAGKHAWLRRHDDAVARARTRGMLRMGNVDAFLCDRLWAGFVTGDAAEPVA